MADKKITWGISIPQAFTDGVIDLGLVRECVIQAEEKGYDSLWVQEQLFGGAPVLEAISLLGYVSAVTSRVKLGTSVMLPAFHDPIRLAKSLSSLDQISGGRLILGVGFGGWRDTYGSLNVPREGLARRFEESLRVMESLWTEKDASFSGEFWKLEGQPMQPKPVTRIPLWFGGRAPAALHRAVRMGDGWMGAGSSSSESFAEGAERVRQLLKDSGRDPATFAIAKRVYLAVDDDKERAERRLVEWFGHFYGNGNLARKVAVWGSAEEVASELALLIKAGAQMLMLNPVLDLPFHIDTLWQDVGPLAEAKAASL
ncbi:MAG: Flavin-dependent oxidoreductase, luciferase family [Chloroflexi bacterium]|jgi:probable F420-dependent oxidoreductase|nr:MAG: Flavin-dependent oxidoreductase, luciferase family [Chloroflexota bacterium]